MPAEVPAEATETIAPPIAQSEAGDKAREGDSTATEQEPVTQTSESTSLEQQDRDKDLELGAKAGDDRQEVPAARAPNIVDFDGPGDLAKAVNWKTSRKWGIVAALSFMTFMS